jgi:hypothetical protein
MEAAGSTETEEPQKRKREGEVREGNFLFPVLKVPNQCPLVLLLEVRLREGKALESEKR